MMKNNADKNNIHYRNGNKARQKGRNAYEKEREMYIILCES